VKVRDHRLRLVVVTLGALLAVFAPLDAARAQFSPGPLSRAHEALEGPRHCTACHKLKGKQGMDERCLSCHAGIKQLIAERRGLHGRADRPECLTCHAEHSGKDNQLVDRSSLRIGVFAHDSVGWPLRAKHLEQKCESCHRRELQSSRLLALEPRPEGAHIWIGLETACSSCHEDPHGSRLGTACADCHQETSFHSVSRDRFVHDRTRFPLRGAHGKVECAKCHDPVMAWGKTPAFASCEACHADAHAGRATIAGKHVDCDACHSTDGFSPSTFTASMHRASPFPLEGKHAAVACGKCHPQNPPGHAPGASGSSGVLLRRDHSRCGQCHADPHGGQFASRGDQGDCQACHTTGGWKPGLFGVAQHQTLRFRLEGKHAQTDCKGCHRARRDELTPATGMDSLGSVGISFRLGEPGCPSCHLDPHDGAYTGVSASPGKLACPECHNLSTFAPSTIDVQGHTRFGYELEGAHRAIPCVDCHPGLHRTPRNSSLAAARGDEPPLLFARKHGECVDCHEDRHRGQLQGSCSRCHDMTAFRPAARFDHDRDTPFALRGAHADVACGRCHPSQTDSTGQAMTIFKPVPVACQGCHLKTPSPSGLISGDALSDPVPVQPGK
jgi:hypothetical protein